MRRMGLHCNSPDAVMGRALECGVFIRQWIAKWSVGRAILREHSVAHLTSETEGDPQYFGVWSCRCLANAGVAPRV